MLKRTKVRYERQLAGPNESRRKSRDLTVEIPQLTHSKTSPYNKDVCFFCDRASAYRQHVNPTARTKYFLIAPDLARLAEQAK